MSLKIIGIICFLFLASFGEVVSDSASASVADTAKLNDTISTKNVKVSEENSIVDSLKSDIDSSKSSESETAEISDTVVEYGEVTISSNPESTSLYFDDELKGYTPITIDSILPGKHVLKLKRSGYYVKKASLNIKAGSSANINFDLIKPSTLKIGSSISNAVISLNGKMVGQTPFENEKLKPGKYEVSLQVPGFEMQDTTLTLSSGSVDSLYFSFGESVETKSEQQESKSEEKNEPKEKTKLQKVLNKVAIGVFAAFTALILLIELNQNND